MNCLAYALRYWKQDPVYRIYHNCDHVVNLKAQVGEKCYPLMVPIEADGYEYFVRHFHDALNEEERNLLRQYFNISPHQNSTTTL